MTHPPHEFSPKALGMNEQEISTNPFRVAWRAAQLLYEELFSFVGISLLTWAALITVILGPPAVAALHEMARLAADGRAVGVQRWWEETRKLFRRAWLVGGLLGVLGVIGWVNVRFYTRFSHIGPYIILIWILLLVLWYLVFLFVWAIMAVQEETRVRFLLRNTLYLVLLFPFHAFFSGIFVAVLTLISLLLPILLLLLPAYVALYTTYLTRQLILSAHERAGSGND
ncbi:MAG: hypothetical protein GXO55_06455 [Chloroflexi bacterium]|nr:hypothetical protein [Chloroflexota bacterium]